MTLLEFLKESGLTYRMISERTIKYGKKISPTIIWRIAKNKTFANPEQANSLVKACEGKVSHMEIFYPDTTRQGESFPN